MRRRISGLVAVILLLAVFTPGTGAHAATEKAKRTVDVGIREPAENEIAQLKLDKAQARRELRQAASATSAPVTTQSTVGEEKLWLAADFVSGRLYLKKYTLRAIGNNIEVWVASDEDVVSTDTNFPEGDCRNGVRTEITDEQVAYLVDQFDNNILPKESATFSVAPDQDGSEAIIQAIFPELEPAGGLLHRGRRRYRRAHRQRAGRELLRHEQLAGVLVRRRVLLAVVPAAPRSQRDDDRRVRLAAPHRRDNPPHEPTDDLCTSAPARPFLYEGVVRARVPAPAPVLRGPGGDDVDERGPRRLGADPDRLRRPDHPDHGARLRQPRPVLPGMAGRADGLESDPT